MSDLLRNSFCPSTRYFGNVNDRQLFDVKLIPEFNGRVTGLLMSFLQNIQDQKTGMHSSTVPEQAGPSLCISG